jgi:hypothetical protein
MDPGKDFSLRGFERTLDPKTVRYLQSKTNQPDKLDLRQISDSVVGELKALQNEASFDYLKIEGETYELLGEIEHADSILGELEGVLKSFRDGLSDVKNEMTFLQEKSLNMNISLNNRKNLSKTFASFIENVMLEPTLIDEILQGLIDDKYVENIKKLCKKLDYIKKYNLMDNLCVREIEPELTKLKIKACERIRTFILDEVALLKKPKTNIQLIQQNKLLKYKMLLLFLRDHNQPIFFEIVQVYSDTMNKIYNSNLSIYINELNKLVETRFTKNHSLLPLSSDQCRTNVFELGDRREIVEDVNQQPIIAHVAQKNNQLFPVEALFKSLNRLLVETVGQEYSFCQTFFCKHFLLSSFE